MHKNGLEVINIELGRCEIANQSIDEETQSKVSDDLVREGFELLQSEEANLVQKIKTEIIGAVYGDQIPGTINLPERLQERLHLSYNTLRRTFSTVEGRSIEQYFISLKIERVKELLKYGEKSIKEIAYDLGYSSPAHLSSQFKQVTGLSPKEFRDSSMPRKPIDCI